MPVSRVAGVVAGSLVLLALAVAPATSASASLGSVPAEVGAYATGGAMVARLQQLYGPGKDGGGTDFGTTAKPGPISRVYEWTDDRYAHADSDHPIQLTNYWTVPITVGGTAVGVAAIGIDPHTSLPELAEFTRSPELATALAKVPADAALVHDGQSAAWFAVAKSTATPLVAGRSGVDGPTPVDELALARATPAPVATEGSSAGIGLAVGVLALLAVVIVAAALLPRLLRRGSGGEPEREPAPQPEPEPAPEPEPEPEPEPAPEPEPEPEPSSPHSPGRRAPEAARSEDARHAEAARVEAPRDRVEARPVEARGLEAAGPETAGASSAPEAAGRRG